MCHTLSAGVSGQRYGAPAGDSSTSPMSLACTGRHGEGQPSRRATADAPSGLCGSLHPCRTAFTRPSDNRIRVHGTLKVHMERSPSGLWGQRLDAGTNKLTPDRFGWGESVTCFSAAVHQAHDPAMGRTSSSATRAPFASP